MREVSIASKNGNYAEIEFSKDLPEFALMTDDFRLFLRITDQQSGKIVN